MTMQSKHKDTDRQEKIYSLLASYLHGETDLSLDRQIQEWIVNGHDKAEKEEALKRIWGELVHEGTPDKEAYEALADIRLRLGFEKVSVKPRLYSLRRVFVSAAAVLVIGFVACGVWLLSSQNGNRMQPSQIALAEPNSEQVAQPQVDNMVPEPALVAELAPKDITVSAGEKGRVEAVLPDGSKVWIHRGGSITYSSDFKNKRTVHLTGEAYFSVVKRDGQEFMVESDDMSVRVMGTEFLMNSGSDAMSSTVEVTSGIVEVSLQNEVYVLTAADRLMYEALVGEARLSDITLNDNATLEEAVAPWKSMALDFENTPLSTVFQKVSTYFGITIAIDENLSLDNRITVKFSEDELLEEVLYVIEATSGSFDFDINTNSVTILSH
jgi:ferric-dicitrate binding protein FerR (iron transport regulator)